MKKPEITKGEYCENCGVFVEGFEYQMCCSGRECGCMGLPVEPCICSGECYEERYLKPKQALKKSGVTFEGNRDGLCN